MRGELLSVRGAIVELGLVHPIRLFRHRGGWRNRVRRILLAHGGRALELHRRRRVRLAHAVAVVRGRHGMRGELLSVRGAIVEAHTRGVGHADLPSLERVGGVAHQRHTARPLITHGRIGIRERDAEVTSFQRGLLRAECAVIGDVHVRELRAGLKLVHLSRQGYTQCAIRSLT